MSYWLSVRGPLPGYTPENATFRGPHGLEPAKSLFCVDHGTHKDTFSIM